MKNRPRPSIPIEVKCRVALRQLGYDGKIDAIIEAHRPDFTVAPAYRRTHGKLLASLLPILSFELGAPGETLPLDHNPPLRWRQYNPRIKDVAARYTPNANDSDALIYRTLADHKLKTNVRGDGAQFPDRVLIKRERKRERKAAGKSPKPARNMRKLCRPIQGRSRWPQGRKLQSRRFPNRSRPHK